LTSGVPGGIEPGTNVPPAGHRQDEERALKNSLSLTLIGFGEVGQIFARELLARGDVKVAAYDLKFDGPNGPALVEKARAAGVTPATGHAAAAKGADIVISAVTASSALDVAMQAATYLAPGQIFFDINSASPGTKTKAAEAVNACGARYVEGAVMAPVPGPNLKVPILSGGPAAAEATEVLNAIGMNVKAVTTEPGRASAMKLCRSIMIKGIEALIVDCAAASKQWNVQEEVFGSLNASFPGVDFADLARYMAQRVNEHGIRRAAEMREAGMMLDDLNMDGSLARAVADAQERGAGKA
jgi:3-hydroxyisobutyrate dehydrogenase-like beta-hydroxyacid dehydrogenase